MKKQSANEKIRRMTTIALFAALAYVSVFLFRIPGIGQFLTFDFKDAIITVAAIFLGPTAAISLSIIVPLLELLISSTGLYGFFMNMISSMTISLVATLIYNKKRTLGGAVLALGCSVVAVTLMMIPQNLFVTPFYLTAMGICPTHSDSFSLVIKLLPTLLIPFNFIKGFTNAAFALMLYKPLTNILKRTKLVKIPTAEPQNVVIIGAEKIKRKKAIRSTIVSICAAVLVITAIVLILVIWDVKISFFDFKK